MQPFQADPWTFDAVFDRPPERKKKPKTKQNEEPSWLPTWSCNLFVVISNESRQAHTLFQPLRYFGDADACMALVIKLHCGKMCEILITENGSFWRSCKCNCIQTYDDKQQSVQETLNDRNIPRQYFGSFHIRDDFPLLNFLSLLSVPLADVHNNNTVPCPSTLASVKQEVAECP